MNAPTPAPPAVARQTFADVPLYDPKRTPVAIDLTDNTNLWGAPPHAEQVLRSCSAAAITRYPSPYCADLKEAIAQYAGVTPDMVTTGCGSDQLIDAAMRAFGEPGTLLAATDPTFTMVPIFSRMNALRATMVTELPDHDADVDALLATGARCIYLCSPNNPTGALVSRRALERVVANAAGIVLIDEAYVEFAGVSNIDLIRQSPHVLLLRTMSKAFGLAGLRVGYALGHPALVREVEKARGPYAVGALSELVAATALRQDVDWVLDHVRIAIEHRDRFMIELLKLGLDPLPSSANFVCVPVPNAVEVAAAMRARGVGVRPFEHLPRIGDALRISVGPWPMMEQCVTTLKAAMKKRKSAGKGSAS